MLAVEREQLETGAPELLRCDPQRDRFPRGGGAEVAIGGVQNGGVVPNRPATARRAEACLAAIQVH